MRLEPIERVQRVPAPYYLPVIELYIHRHEAPNSGTSRRPSQPSVSSNDKPHFDLKISWKCGRIGFEKAPPLRAPLDGIIIWLA